MNELKENASDIEYVVEGVVHNSFANNPVAKDDQNTVKIQNLARAALCQGVNVSVPFTTTEQRQQATAGNKVTQPTQNSQTSASNDVESKIEENQTASKETMNYPKVEEAILNKYDGTLDIFEMVFWWLLPGRVGGSLEISPKKKTLRTWTENCIYYK